MACSGCGTGENLPRGCKNNGSCGVDGCDKLSVFDWLSNMQQPTEELRSKYVEVRFKNERKEFYINSEDLPLKMGDIVAVECNPGHDVGIVTLTGALVKAQLKHKKTKNIDRLAKVYRIANQRDIDVWQKCREREQQMMLDARRIARETGLEMKISDVEFQGDGNKATFYYTSETRIDFRQLIRDFASAFKCRIEMRQIGYRQEAAKVGGIGSCGRELCCSTWLTDFRSVSTTAARYQQLSINPQKIAGQCGKLKCCLNFELDTYLDALKEFPSSETKISTRAGDATSVKIDVFKKEVWLAYIRSENSTWYRFTVSKVNDFILQNKKGKKIESLEELDKKFNEKVEPVFGSNLIEENDLTRFESKNKRRKQRNKRKTPNAKKSQQNQGNKGRKKPNKPNKKRNNE